MHRTAVDPLAFLLVNEHRILPEKKTGQHPTAVLQAGQVLTLLSVRGWFTL